MKRFFLCVLLTAAVCFAAIPLLGSGQLMGTAEAADAYLYGNKNMPYVIIHGQTLKKKQKKVLTDIIHL